MLMITPMGKENYPVILKIQRRSYRLYYREDLLRFYEAYTKKLAKGLPLEISIAPEVKGY